MKKYGKKSQICLRNSFKYLIFNGDGEIDF